VFGPSVQNRLILFLLVGLVSCVRVPVPFAVGAKSGAMLLDAAIAARGGRVAGLVREVSAKVALGYTGQWTWVMEVRAPDFLRWEIGAAGARQALVHDRGAVRRFLGTAELPPAAGQASELGPMALFLTTIDLDALLRPEAAELERLPAGELAAGAAAGLRVQVAGTSAPFHLYFDERGLLVRADGPFASAITGPVTLSVTRSEFRLQGGLLLPAREDFQADGHEFVKAEIERWRVLR
jgi:hypothetical protein